MSSKNKISAMISVTLGQSLWGISYLFTRIALQYTNIETLLSLRFLCAFTTLILLSFLGKIKISIWQKEKQSKYYLLIFAILQPLYYLLESNGILLTNTAFAGITLSITPVVAIFIGHFFLHEPTSSKQFLFCLLPIVGVIIISLSGTEIGAIQPLGILFLFGTCIVAALLNLTNKKAATYTPFERTFVTVLAGSMVYTPLALHTSHWNIAIYFQPLQAPLFLISLLSLAFLCSLSANTLVNVGAKELSVAQFSIFLSLNIVVSMLSGVFILHEPMPLTSLFGAILIIVGIFFVGTCDV